MVSNPTSNGVTKDTEESEARANKSEVITSSDHYSVIAPLHQPCKPLPRYEWLNGVQCIGKIVENKNNSYAKYDVFVVRCDTELIMSGKRGDARLFSTLGACDWQSLENILRHISDCNVHR
jgi:hypothetical protein